MPITAKLYVESVIAVGFAILIGGVSQWHCTNLGQYLSYLGLAIVASTRKVQLPGITGTYSLSFLFILLGITTLGFAETLTIGFVSGVMQSVWKAKVRPRLIQVLFNVGNIVVSIAISYLSQPLGRPQAYGGLLIVLAFAASLFFMSNTLLVSGVLSMVDRQPFRRVWSQWILWSFPYYLTGTAIAGLMTASNQQLGWQLTLACLPLMYLASLCYQLYVDHHASSAAQPRI